jgi:hypothetical protein
MKLLFFAITFWLFYHDVDGQVLNGDFENNSNSDLSNWEWTCFAEPSNIVPPEGNNWSLKVWGGNTQGCFPGYAYQKLPEITIGQSYILTAWALAESATEIGIFFGKINNGEVTIQTGDTSSSNSWTQLSVQSTLSMPEGDTAIVVLYGGLSGGPIQGYGYFDLINLEQIAGLHSIEQSQTIKLYPNPFSNQTTLIIDKQLHDARLTINNNLGQIVKEIEIRNSKTTTIQRDGLTGGLYFIHLIERNKIIATSKLIICDK